MAVLRPDLMMKCVVPVVMAGIIAVRYRLSFSCRMYVEITYSLDLWACSICSCRR